MLARYDRDGDYKMSRLEFVNEINPLPQEDENDVLPDEAEDNNDYQRNATHNEEVKQEKTNSNFDKLHAVREEDEEEAKSLQKKKSE